MSRRISPLSSTASLPLSGASVYILTDGQKTDTRAMEMGAFILGLGGDLASDPVDATHALWISNSAEYTESLEKDFVKCQAEDVVIVDASWLERVSGLNEKEHWSDIDIGSHVPAVVALMDDSFGMPRKKGRDDAAQLRNSITETFAYLTKEDPDLVEEDAIRRAMELSMLDCALVYRKGDPPANVVALKQQTPHEILGVKETATPAEIRAAYRKLALKTHPDKGGDAEVFSAIAKAYRSLLHASMEEAPIETNLKSTAHWDNELQDHRRLVEDLFQHHGADLEENASKQRHVLESLDLIVKDAGAYNVNEKDEKIANSCFYLSLANSYLIGIGALTNAEGDSEEDIMLQQADKALVGETALQLKRTIEAAVVSAHPEWAYQGIVGEEVQAFSDFLVYTLDSTTLLSEWAVAIFDTTSGFVDVYKGKHYSGIATNNDTWARSNTITILYTPGHYQSLIPNNGDRPTLETILEALDKNEVFYVVTDGAAE